jgi:hypothetical protein
METVLVALASLKIHENRSCGLLISPHIFFVDYYETYDISWMEIDRFYKKMAAYSQLGRMQPFSYLGSIF